MNSSSSTPKNIYCQRRCNFESFYRIYFSLNFMILRALWCAVCVIECVLCPVNQCNGLIDSFLKHILLLCGNVKLHIITALCVPYCWNITYAAAEWSDIPVAAMASPTNWPQQRVVWITSVLWILKVCYLTTINIFCCCAFFTISSQIETLISMYRVIKKSLCTWWLQHRKL
jgi:hypothetical protein